MNPAKIVWDEPKRRKVLEERGLDFADVTPEFLARAVTVEERGVRRLVVGVAPRSRGRCRLCVVRQGGRLDRHHASGKPEGEEPAMTKRRVPEITPEEEALLERIVAEGDPDDYFSTDEELANARQQVSIRLDPDVLAKLKATGPGWQRRVNDILRKAVG
jgi:uncharacterized protein (DUF4415 family)